MKKIYIIILIIVGLLLIIGISYAMNLKKIIGNGYAIIAEPILEIEVEDKNNEENLNSYYNVILKNYNAEGKVSEVSYNYEIKVTTQDGSEVPEYDWYSESGDLIGKELKGSLSNSVEEQQVFKICFINSGEENIISKIKFETTAIQKND